jgi:hypothetical protein
MSRRHLQQTALVWCLYICLLCATTGRLKNISVHFVSICWLSLSTYMAVVPVVDQLILPHFQRVRRWHRVSLVFREKAAQSRMAQQLRSGNQSMLHSKQTSLSTKEASTWTKRNLTLLQRKKRLIRQHQVLIRHGGSQCGPSTGSFQMMQGRSALGTGMCKSNVFPQSSVSLP